MIGPCVTALLAMVTQNDPMAPSGYTNLGDGVCVNGAWGRSTRPGVAFAMSWHRPAGASAPFNKSSCADLCDSLDDDCVGFNEPSTLSSGCAIYTNPMGVLWAVNPQNGSFTNRPCYKKNGGDVSDYNYRVIPTRTTWDLARARCLNISEIGSDLASARTIWHARAIYAAAIAAGIKRAWIGLRDYSQDNHFKWSDNTGSFDIATYAGFYHNFPSHTSRINNDAQDCAGVLGAHTQSNWPGSWFNANCDDIGVYDCNPQIGAGVAGTAGVKHNVISTGTWSYCNSYVTQYVPLADGITWNPTTNECWAHFNMNGTIESPGCGTGKENVGYCCSGGTWQGCQSCKRQPKPASVGFVCGYPTGITAAPTTGPPSSPAPTPWFEDPSHRSNISEMQSRMTAAETLARDTAAKVERMRLSLGNVTADLSNIRAALLQAVNTEPTIPERCVGDDCIPSIAAEGESVSISARVGTVGVTTQACQVDDLCGAGSFAENLKEALRDI